MTLFDAKRTLVEGEAAACNDYSLQLNRWFLEPLGAWPETDGTSRSKKILSRILILAGFFLIGFVVVPYALFILYEETDSRLKLKCVGPISHWLMGAINYSSLLLRARDILGCMRHMETDWRISKKLEDREVMMRHAKIGRFVAGFCAMFMHGGVLSYSIVQGIGSAVTVIGNETVLVPKLAFPFPRKIYDMSRSPAYEIAFGLQFASSFVVNSTTIGACSLAAVFAMHACGQLNLLTLRLNELVSNAEKNRDLVDQRLADFVEHHLRVLSFISRIEDVMQQICLVEVVGCTFNLCLLGYYCITSWNDIDKRGAVTYVVIYISMTFNIFTFCYIGEILTEKCKKIGETAYMTDWYYLPQRTALNLILIIIRSHTITRITAGKLIPLSVVTFGDAVRTSLVYLNMLRTLMM